MITKEQILIWFCERNHIQKNKLDKYHKYAINSILKFVMEEYHTEEELKQVFENNSNCYADSDEVVMAMDKERFIETLKGLKILPNKGE